MKTAPPPDVPGNSPWERMSNALRAVLTVPKDAVVKEEARIKRARQKKRIEKAR